ncbi:MAG TPA: RNA polymerase sigma factor [Anaerolineales bacterium]|jgi:RNA polymerase sigma-70 factor (ECF subfamily)|nr:RNA polymerase sigma factor [Anaerolineales bacterium]
MTALTATQPNELDKEEIDLAQRATTDGEAFAELYRRHLTRVYRYHAAHVGNAKDAEDLTSQTFIAALEGIHSFRGTGSFAAWILGIASKKRLMFYRGNKTEIPLDDALHYPNPGLPTDKVAAQRLQLESVFRALQRISPDRAEALILTYFGGLSQAEAGRVLNKSEAAVKMLVSRGLQDLRKRTSLALEVEYE